MSAHELSKGLRLTRTADSIEKDRKLARQQRAWKRRQRRRRVQQRTPVESGDAAAEHGTGAVPF